MSYLADLKFQNHFVEQLPGEGAVEGPQRSRKVLNACYSLIKPTSVSNPQLVLWSDLLASELGIKKPVAGSADVQILAGNKILSSMKPYAACYGGHQFGNWAGQLGDGRAITLGEISSPQGSCELQLKGAGPTPYSRRADGRAVLRSSLREFICSEAMHALGVPTTRALSVVLTGDLVNRDMFYDGHPKDEPGAIVCRVAPSFLRFGNFEIFTSRNDLVTLRALVDFTIRNYFPQYWQSGQLDIFSWFEEVCSRTASLMAQWMSLGFVHGVLNTDNMSILGLSIDYGPFGWLDNFDPGWTPNTTDNESRRYCFGNQPEIGLWNLQCLADALTPLVSDPEQFNKGLEKYLYQYTSELKTRLTQKLGFDKLENDYEWSLVEDLEALFGKIETDSTLFYQRLIDFKEELIDSPNWNPQFAGEFFKDCFYADPTEVLPSLFAWLEKYTDILLYKQVTSELRIQRMQKINPVIIPRNYLLQEAIESAEAGDYSKAESLYQACLKPYERVPQFAHLAQKRPDWARHKAGCSMLSCSS